MNKNIYYEMLTFMGAAIREAHKVIVEELSLQNEDQNKVMEQFNQLINSLAMEQVIKEYGQEEAACFLMNSLRKLQKVFLIILEL